MARTALHERDTQSSASNSPITHKATSSPQSASGQKQLPSKSTRALEIISPMYHQQLQCLQGDGQPPALDSLCVPSQPPMEASAFISNQATSLSGLEIGGTWDPADFAVMDILDGGIAPWTAEYLTDGQSGIDPFLFPFWSIYYIFESPWVRRNHTVRFSMVHLPSETTQCHTGDIPVWAIDGMPLIGGLDLLLSSYTRARHWSEQPFDA